MQEVFLETSNTLIILVINWPKFLELKSLRKIVFTFILSLNPAAARILSLDPEEPSATSSWWALAFSIDLNLFWTKNLSIANQMYVNNRKYLDLLFFMFEA